MSEVGADAGHGHAEAYGGAAVHLRVEGDGEALGVAEPIAAGHGAGEILDVAASHAGGHVERLVVVGDVHLGGFRWGLSLAGLPLHEVRDGGELRPAVVIQAAVDAGGARNAHGARNLGGGFGQRRSRREHAGGAAEYGGNQQGKRGGAGAANRTDHAGLSKGEQRVGAGLRNPAAMRSNFRKPAVRHWPIPCGAVTFFSLIGARDCVDGMWRSPVAHLNGVQGVAGSNPVIPTA